MKITIEHLTKKFGSIKALDDVSLEINDGELFFLLGPSGCGKTTLLRCIGGFETPTSGIIHLGEQDVSSLPPNKRNSAMVFQGYALWPHMSVHDNIAFGLQMRKLPANEIESRVKKAMESVQIANLGSRKPNELSGGQQQRVALARTLVVHPGCLLLDEPLANLDAKLRRDMRHEIRALCKDNGLTAVYVTHDRQEALSMADRLAVLRDGKIIQVGKPQDIYRSPSCSFVSSFIGEANFIKGKLTESIPGCVRIETPAGIIEAEKPGDAQKGDDVILSIRPEAIAICNDDFNGNLIPATITQSAYIGEVTNHNAITDNGSLPLSFIELNPEYSIKPGTKVTLAFNRRDVVVLKQ